MRVGDEVVVNVAALDLGLGSGGFDVVHVNLTRGLESGGGGDAHVMKLNYTSLQHPVESVERPNARFLCPDIQDKGTTRSAPVAVLPLHGDTPPPPPEAGGGGGGAGGGGGGGGG